MKTSAIASTPRPKNWLLTLMRRWHLWGGVGVALFLMVFALTGIVLNYKGPVFRALGLDAAPAAKSAEAGRAGRRPDKEPPAELTTERGLQAATVPVERALALAREAWGEAPLERIELKAEHGGLVWKIKEKGGSELIVNALTGDHFTKGPYERIQRNADDGTAHRSTDWGKLLIDLHTGKIGGDVGKAVMTAAAGALIFLTLSGLYLWLKPLLLRRANARARATSAAAAGPQASAQPAPALPSFPNLMKP